MQHLYLSSRGSERIKLKKQIQNADFSFDPFFIGFDKYIYIYIYFVQFLSTLLFNCAL